MGAVISGSSRENSSLAEFPPLASVRSVMLSTSLQAERMRSMKIGIRTGQALIRERYRINGAGRAGREICLRFAAEAGARDWYPSAYS